MCSLVPRLPDLVYLEASHVSMHNNYVNLDLRCKPELSLQKSSC